MERAVLQAVVMLREKSTKGTILMEVSYLKGMKEEGIEER